MEEKLLLFHRSRDIVGQFFVGEDVLHIVVLIEDVVKLLHGSGEAEVINGSHRRRNVGDLRTRGFNPRFIERMDDVVELGNFATHFIAIIAGDDVIGSGFDGDFHQGVFLDLVLRDEELANVQKLE